MKRRKITSIAKIWNGKKLKRTNFSNLDLEGLDLSMIPEEAWEGCVFNNTSVKNTGIKLSMNSLFGNKYSVKPFDTGFQVIKNCDFSDNDLQPYITQKHTSYTLFDSCNFSNTNVTKNIYGRNNILDKSFTRWELDRQRPILDIDTLKNNSQLYVNSIDLLRIITIYLKHHNCKEKIKIIEEYLQYDKDGELLKLYNILKENLTENEIIYFFFHLVICDKKFNSINFEDISFDLLSYIDFINCKFDNLTFELGINPLLYIRRNTFNVSNKYNKIITPNITYSSWQEKPNGNDRLSNTPMTFRTNLYLELSRSCNAKCEFCRNAYYCDNDYDLEKIKNSLCSVSPKIDSVVIGGGEPTLKLNDIKEILEDCRIITNYNDLYLFTNGTHKYIDDELSRYKFNYNVSRHAVSDDDNARIFGIDKKKIMSTQELKDFIDRTVNTTLAATCFKGALDTKEKIIEYINYAISLGCKSILLSDLIVMEDSLLNNKENYNINIDSNVFDDVVDYLMLIGFRKSIPIYATGGYVLTMLKKDGINISFKHYISKKELEENWPSATKRTFDLSIDPSGNLYENWHQTSGLIKQLKK